jgi:hypothetical protein
VQGRVELRGGPGQEALGHGAHRRGRRGGQEGLRAAHQAVAAADGASLGVIDLSSPREGLEPEDRAALQEFARPLAAKLAAMAPPVAKLPEPPPPTDLPREADLRPPPPPEAPGPDLVAPASAGTRPAVIGTAVGAGVAAAAAVALGIVGFTEQSKVPTGGRPTTSWQDAKAHAANANSFYGSAGAAAGVAAVLAAVAVVLQVSD